MFSVIIHSDHNYHHTKHTIEQCVNLFVRTITAPKKQITMSEMVTIATWTLLLNFFIVALQYLTIPSTCTISVTRKPWQTIISKHEVQEMVLYV